MQAIGVRSSHPVLSLKANCSSWMGFPCHEGKSSCPEMFALTLCEPSTHLALVPLVHLGCAVCSGLVLAAKVLQPALSGGLALSMSPGELQLPKPATFPSSLGESLWKHHPRGTPVCLREVSPSRLGALTTPLIPLQICGGFRVEKCTPAQCQGLLCLRDNGTACGAGLSCRGAFPRSAGALGTATKASRELGGLSARLRDTAQLVSVCSCCCTFFLQPWRACKDEMSF